ncbi:hypothetical protein [Crinalium epipsammum]|nr:hypothetical protein [Crinalium epipsammum]
MYYWIFNSPRLFQNLALFLPPVDITFALFPAWLSSLVCITFPAHKTLLQAISPSQAAVVLTFIGVAGIWSGWFVEKFIF